MHATGEFDRAWSLLSHPTPRVVSAAAGRVFGRLRLPTGSLPLPGNLRLGWFVTAFADDVNGSRIAEGRVEMIPTADPAEFAFTLDAATIAERHGCQVGTLWFDLVREGEYWFSSRAPGALRVELALPAPLLGSAIGRALLQRVLGGAGQAALLDAVLRAEARRGIGLLLREGLLAPEALPPASRPPRPLPAAASREVAQAGSQLPARLQAALLEREPWAPGPADTEYFQRSRIVHHRTGAGLSPAMLDAMAIEAPERLAAALSSDAAVRRWWLFDMVLPHPLPLDAIPQEHRRHWLAPFVADAVAPANRYLIEAWERAHNAPDQGSVQDPSERLAFQLAQIVAVWRDHRRFMLLGEDAVAFWAQPLAVGGRMASLFTLLCAMARDTADPLGATDPLALLADGCEAAARLVEEHCPTLRPLLGRHAQPGTARPPPAYIVGNRRRPGAAAALRMMGEAMQRLGVAARLFDVAGARPLGLTADGRLGPWVPGLPGIGADGTARPLSLFLGEAARLPALARDAAFSGILARQRIGVLAWGFAELPASHANAARELDSIWAQSRFAQAAIARATGREVPLLGVAIDLPDTLPDPYGELLPGRQERFVFHAACNPAAGLRRSNPSAVVSGFLQAFPRGTEAVALVLRVPEDAAGEAADPFGEWLMIQEAALRDRRILLIEEAGPRERALAFVRHADCVVSAHRSLAFGMLCAQAHRYAVPLVATGWSGNMEFCDAGNTWLVEHMLRDIQPGEHLEDVRAAWADCRLEHLAAQMQAVVARRDEARAMALRGQALVRERYAPARFDAVLRGLLRAV